MEARSICIFCGSRVGERAIYAEAARDLGAALAANGISLVYGGGNVGLMGIVADAVSAGGGRVIGVMPDFLARRELANTGADELIVTGSMHERKQRMFDLADAFVVLPGGIGTLDETLEMLTWKQLRQHDKPVVLFDVAGCWRPLVALIDAVIGNGFAPEWTRRLFDVVERAEDVLPAIRRTASPPGGTSAGL